MAHYICTNCPNECEVTMNVADESKLTPHQCFYNWDNDCDVEWKEVDQTELDSALDRILDMYNSDDGQAWKEASKFLLKHGRI